MLHTFVILAYKESPYLEECIISLINQTVTSNIIISTSTPSIFLEELSKKYQLKLIINNNTNQTMADDWNFAYKIANTKYVTLAHQDDIYQKDFSSYIINQNNEFLISFSNYYELKGDKLITNHLNLIIKKIMLLPFYFKKIIKNKMIKKLILAFGSPIPCPTVTFNKDLIGEFMFNSQYKVNLDWDAWIKFAKMDGYFYFVKRPLLIHRIHEGSETSIGIKDKVRFTEDYKIFSLIWGKQIAKLIIYFYKFSYKSND